MPRYSPFLLVPPFLIASLALGCRSGVVREFGSAEGTPEQRFFDWTDLAFSKETYADRRERLIARLRETGGGVFLAPSVVGRSQGGTFRQLDDFLYFTGLELPDSVLAVDADEGRVELFVPDRDPRFENPARPNDFPGRPLGADPELGLQAGILGVRAAEQFETALSSWVAAGRLLRLRSGRTRELEPPAEGFAHPVSPEESLAWHVFRAHPTARVQSAFDAVARLRMVKSAEELARVRRACDITSQGIREAARHVRPGVDERTLEAELEAAFKRGGAQRRAFDSIIKSGPNSLWAWRILAAHYDRRNRVMRHGDLVLFDVGCELDHYASDVGRTFPVSGAFTEEQERLVAMQIAVSDAIIAAVRPGVTFADLQAVAVRAIPLEERGCMQTGLFFGHHIGLDVGDPSLPEVPLAPGMVFTVEPWYYDHEGKVAVFIEDVVVVTETGCENLTASLPRTPEGLERMVGAGRKGL